MYKRQVWYWQQNYDVAYTSIWWGLMEGPAMIVIALSGWVIYRYRQTRAMTLPQFFEMRYSRRFRIFAGPSSRPHQIEVYATS